MLLIDVQRTCLKSNGLHLIIIVAVELTAIDVNFVVVLFVDHDNYHMSCKRYWRDGIVLKLRHLMSFGSGRNLNLSWMNIYSWG